MGRHYFSSKQEADGLRKITTTFLKKHGYFSRWQSGTITWTSGWDERKNDVGIQTYIAPEGSYLRIWYTQTNRDTGEKKDFDYKIPLETTPGRYGGQRFWFICPWYKSGVYCGKRIGVLYKGGDYFACRHCYELTYESRNAARRYRGFVSIPDIDKAESEIKRYYYKGKPTKKYQRFLQLDRKFEKSFLGLAATLDKKPK